MHADLTIHDRLMAASGVDTEYWKHLRTTLMHCAAYPLEHQQNVLVNIKRNCPRWFQPETRKSYAKKK